MTRLQFATINWNGSVDPLFKVALVLGPSRVLGKQRVRVWLHASRRYTDASAVETGKLTPIDSRTLSKRHRKVYEAAVRAAHAEAAKELA